MAGVSEQERYQQWLAQINHVCGRFNARPLEGEFIGELETSYARSLKLSTVTAGGVNLFRSRQEIKQSNDAWFYTVFQLDGSAEIEQDDRCSILNAGDITLIDASRPCSINWQQKSRQISLLVPRQIIEQQCRFQEVSCALTLSRSLPTVQLSHRLLLESMSNADLSERESEAALEAMICLLRPAFQQRDAVQPRKERQFRNVLSLIDDHIQSESLRPEWIAAESGMSVRSLYRMFADKGLVVAQYIKNRRLDLCAQVLRSASDEEKLAGIGYSWGFADHSHFSTAFKQRFGVSPGEYRKRFR
ncbi:transcriptional regulator FeaR [Enterobacter cloacae subsp. cloacae]|uniref:transcriptional regulator FeaR n=1 Tax=Enterobacter cloacae TaxID=550 RepID=UPI00068027B6|nr:transcriptional regulator FeaR [Enterobacter cloacae]MBW4199775.1 transcriptional regulator FeaR [Enterobacter cloacae subsp. cloacae]RHI05621.1 transcriptional regulator FeaR [Enterobacter cloacae]